MPKLSLAVVSLAVLLAAGWAGSRAVAARPVAAAADTDQVPAAGQPAPTFTLPSQTGTPTSLASFHGKWVVLYF